MRYAHAIIKGQKGRFRGIWLEEVIGEKMKTVSYLCSIVCRLFN